MLLCFACLPPLFCVPNVASVISLSILDCHFFSIVYLTLQLGIVAVTDVSGVRHYHVNDWWISLTQINA